jgi:hypothetical protein
MNYYKIIQDTTFIGVVTSRCFRKYQHKYGLLLICPESESQYVKADNGKYYRDIWMQPFVTDEILYSMADIVSITQEEYDMLSRAIENNEVISVENIIDDETIDPIEEVTIDFIKTSKIAEMNYLCNKTITNGFDVVLSDDNSYHFSLTTQDQLNLITLSSMVESGETQIPYHADGEPCKFYSVEDISAIITKATEFKTYHVSYFNSLKTYINSMETKEEIAVVIYGIEIPEEYQSEVLKSLLNK